MPNIEKRGTNTWRLTVDGGFDTKGKRIWHRKTIKVEDTALLGAKRKLQDYLELEALRFQQQVEKGQYVKPERTTFEDFIPVWKANYADQHLGAYTRRHYAQMIRAHLLPAFGHMELSKIKTMHIVAFLTHLRTPEGRKDGKNAKDKKDKPLAANSQLNIYKTLKSILDAATKWRMIPANPMSGVDRPTPDKAEKKAIRTKKRSYTPLEAEALITALSNEPPHWRLYFLGLLLGGFRRGELLGVEWPQVDFENGGIHIEKQISLDENGKPIEAPLKTETSEGFVPMPKWYMNELTQYRKGWLKEKLKQGVKWKGANKQYLFHAGTGEMFYPSAPSLHWRRFLSEHDLPIIRLHDLRHTTAMLLREDGVDLKSIQERLRHSRLSITADLYTHESIQVSRETADRLEKFDPHRTQSQ